MSKLSALIKQFEMAISIFGAGCEEKKEALSVIEELGRDTVRK